MGLPRLAVTQLRVADATLTELIGHVNRGGQLRDGLRQAKVTPFLAWTHVQRRHLELPLYSRLTQGWLTVLFLDGECLRDWTCFVDTQCCTLP